MDQEATKTQLEVDLGDNSTQETIVPPELGVDSIHLTPEPVTFDDKAKLKDNRSPSPVAPEKGPAPPENGPASGSIKQRTHPELVLKVSQGSHVSVPIDKERRPVMRAKSVTTSGGRVVRNVTENNSIKYNIGSAFEKHPSDFADYGNPFRPGSIKKGEQRKQSLKRDGQKRRTSSYERSDSDRTVSVSSEEMSIKAKKDPGITVSSKEMPIKAKKAPGIIHQFSTESCTSTTSTKSLVESNPYNDYNHKITSVVWCPCFFFFCFGCSVPAFHFMNRSDKLFDEGEYDKSRTNARIATALYIVGIFLSMAFWAAIFSVIIIFATPK